MQGVPSRGAPEKREWEVILVSRFLSNKAERSGEQFNSGFELDNPGPVITTGAAAPVRQHSWDPEEKKRLFSRDPIGMLSWQLGATAVTPGVSPGITQEAKHTKRPGGRIRGINARRLTRPQVFPPMITFMLLLRQLLEQLLCHGYANCPWLA
jgi:hypothetical protein